MMSTVVVSCYHATGKVGIVLNVATFVILDQVGHKIREESEEAKLQEQGLEESVIRKS